MFAFPGEDLMERQDTLDQDIAISQKFESEKEVPTGDPPLHTEPKDNEFEDTCDASQQGSNLSYSQLEKDMDKDGE